MIHNNLRLIMAEKRIDNLTDLMNLTGLSRNALLRLWRNDNVEAANLSTLIVICDKLKVPLSRLIEYLPD